jgi:hypothetical protein
MDTDGVDQSKYVIEPLALGWYCPSCGCFNGDEKVFLLQCRACETDRPKRSSPCTEK